jgi:sigma-B regulation protein RsbU (phosphoserine phosphatase)
VLLNDDIMYSTFECAYLEPIVYQNEILGLIVIRYSKKDSAKIESHTVDLIRVLAQFGAIALANPATSNQRKEHDRTETELEVASEIQRSLLPSKFPQNEHCRLTGKCVTALAVGGDYIDAIDIRGQGLLLIIADVMGKGIPAALLATIFRTAIRSRLNLAETPGWLLSKIDEQFHEELGHLNMFITAQAAYFSYEKKTLKLSSAGPCPAFLMKGDTSFPEELTAEGIPLGIDPAGIYEERIMNLDTGDRVLFITDGIYETENEAGEMLGIDGFSKRLPEIWNDGLEAVPDKALAVVANHSHGNDYQDDKTLMALEVL